MKKENKKGNKMPKEPIFIYNKFQALFYINEKKMYLYDTGVHLKSGKMFFVFDRDLHKKYFSEWIDKQNNK